MYSAAGPASAVLRLSIAAAQPRKSVVRFTVYLLVENLQLRLAHGLRQSVSVRSCAFDQFSIRSLVSVKSKCTLQTNLHLMLEVYLQRLPSDVLHHTS